MAIRRSAFTTSRTHHPFCRNQATEDWKRDGYSCYPEPPYDNTFNVRFNASECTAALLSPSEDTVKSGKYFPFAIGNPYPTTFVTAVIAPYAVCQRLISQHYYGSCGGHAAHFGTLLPSGSGFECNSGENFIFVGNFDHWCNIYPDNTISQTDAIQAWNEILATPRDYYGEFGNELICNEL